jgi:hypothetical protein
MSKKPTEASFSVAVKHLFRHLRDVRGLEKNPLVREFFADPNVLAMRRVDRERLILGKIHELVRKGADELLRDDIAAGKGDIALRRHAIVTQQCLEGRPIRDVAAELGISYHHCYRERAVICTRLGRHFFAQESTATLNCLLEMDEFQLLRSRALNRAAFVDADATFKESTHLIRVASSPLEKIEALDTAALIAMRFGDTPRAERMLGDAEALWSQHFVTLSSEPSITARGFTDLIAAKLSRTRADSASALRLAQRATSLLEPMSTSGANHLREMYVESVFELGVAFCIVGALDRGYRCIADAESKLASIRAASPQLRTRIAIEAWKLRSCLLTSSQAWHPFSERLKGLTTALNDALAQGMLSEVAATLETLTAVYAYQGNHDEALRVGRFAVTIAKQQSSRRVLAHTQIKIVMNLLNTKHWQVAQSLLPDVRSLEACDAHHRAMARYVFAESALRLQHPLEARKIVESDDRAEYATLALHTQLISASAEHMLGRGREARAIMESTLPAAERLGSATSLRDAYRVAARITGERRFARQASEFSRLLSA